MYVLSNNSSYICNVYENNEFDEYRHNNLKFWVTFAYTFFIYDKYYLYMFSTITPGKDSDKPCMFFQNDIYVYFLGVEATL